MKEGRYAHRPRQVTVRGRVRKERSEPWHDAGEPEPLTETEQSVLQLADLKQRQGPARSQHSAEFAHDAWQVGEVPDREAAHDSVGRCVANRDGGCVCLQERSTASTSGAQHAERQVDPDRAVSFVPEIPGEVTGPAAHVENRRPADRPNMATVFRRHDTSSPNVIRRFTRS